MGLRDSLRQFPGQRLRRFPASGYLLAAAHYASRWFLHAGGPDFLVGLDKKQGLGSSAMPNMKTGVLRWSGRMRVLGCKEAGAVSSDVVGCATSVCLTCVSERQVRAIHQRPQSTLIWWLIRLLRAAFLFYLLLAVLLMIFLENYLIYPGVRRRGGDWDPQNLAYQAVQFHSADGTRLHGWYLEHDEPRAQVLVCYGNGDNVAAMADYLGGLRDRFQVSVLAFDYRGYGRSAGRPHEAGVLEDGHAAQQFLARRADCQLTDIVVLGRSLGGGVAVDLAARNGARALILERTFTSIPDVAHAQFPWLPVRWLLKTRFDSLAKIGDYAGPLLQCHGTIDTVVPFELGRQLFDAAPATPKQFVSMPGVGHSDPPTMAYHRAMEAFFDRIGDGAETLPIPVDAMLSHP